MRWLKYIASKAKITLVKKNADVVDDAGDCSRGGAQGKQVSLVLFEYQPLEIII